MYELAERVVTNAWGVWRFRWKTMLVAWLVCLAGWAVVYIIPDQYESSTRVYIDTQSVLKPLLQGLAVETDVTTTAGMITQALKSRANLEFVSNETDLHKRVDDEKGVEAQIVRLGEKITITEDHNKQNTYLITYQDPDPQTAQKVVDKLLSGFVERTLGVGRKDNAMAREFLDDQIAGYQARLEEAEQQLKEFKRENMGTLPDLGMQGVDYYDRLQVAVNELNAAQLKYREIRNRVAQLESQVGGEEPTFMGIGNKETAETRALDSRIAALKKELDNLLLKFTEQHPDIVTVQQAIQDLEVQKEDALNNSDGFYVSEQLEKNPVYQQLNIALGKAGAEAAALRARVGERQRRVNELRSLVDTVPEVEAELKKLNRDYSVVKANYEALLERREAAKLSKDAEQSTDDIQFRIIDPPRVPLSPAGPPRMIFSSVVLVAGLGAGVVLAFVLAQIAPVFYSPRSVRSYYDLPLLGSVSRVSTAGVKTRQRLALMYFAVAGCLLFATYGTLMVLGQREVDIRAGVGSLVSTHLPSVIEVVKAYL